MFPSRNFALAHSSKPTLPALAGWAFAFSLFSSLSWGQPTDLYFHHLGLAEGLSQSTNGCIYRDSSGFVWIGSAQGLNRFDGVQVKVYNANAANPRQLADPTVTSPIFEDDEHDLWFCTVSAIHCYRRKTDDFERFVLHNERGEPMKNYSIFHLDRKGQLWVYCEGVVIPFQTKSRQKQEQKPWHINGYPLHFHEKEDDVGLLYCWEEQGLSVFRWQQGQLVASGTLFDGQNSMPTLEVNAVLHESDGTLWACSNDGVWKYVAGQRPTKVNDESIGQANQMAAWGKRYLFITSANGLYLVDKARCQTVRHWKHDNRWHNSLSAGVLGAIHIDRDDNLWLSSWTKGIDYTNLRKLKFNTVRHFIGEGPQQSTLFVPGLLIEGEAGQVWAGSQMHGLVELDSAGHLLRDFRALVPEPDQMFDLGRSTLLINNFYGGLCLFFPEKKQVRPILYEGKPLVCDHLCRDVGNIFLVAPRGQAGLLRLVVHEGGYSCEALREVGINGTEWSHLEKIGPDHLLIADEKYSIYEFKLGKPPVLRHREAGYVNCTRLDGTSVWVGTSTNLLRFHSSDGKIEVFDHEDGLPNEMIYSIEKVGPNEFWLGTGRGLVRFAPQDNHFQTFGMADGLQSFESNRSSSLLTRSGMLWFGGINGINLFRPGDIKPCLALPQIQLTELRVNDAPYPMPQNITLLRSIELPYDSATLAVYFSALEFADPQNNQIKFRLFGVNGAAYDQDWVKYSNLPGFARYANLPPGRYQLQIMAANSDGVWSPDVKTLDIHILPPWWQTGWFRALAACTLALATYAFYRYRLGQLRRRLEQQNRMTLLELDALRAQLNPHFISNSLVAINYYIRNNGVERVRQYVNTLARLMRDVLTSARQASVSVDDELAMLRNYVEVESGQFLQPIDFEITVDEGIPTGRIQMPGMLLQPFVENAIRHGLKPRQGQGSIRLRVEAEQQALIFTLTDNGVGRAAAKTAKTKSDEAGGEYTSGPQKSHGLDITRKRLQLYDQYQQTTSRSGFEIKDLYLANGSAAGTEVQLRLCLPQNSTTDNTTFAA